MSAMGRTCDFISHQVGMPFISDHLLLFDKSVHKKLKRQMEEWHDV
jgi:hypothetical protein